MMFPKTKHRLMNEAPGGDGGGGTGGGAPNAGQGDGAPPAGSPPAAPPSVLAGGAPQDPTAWLSEKFRVPGEDGKVNVEASAKKLAEAYGQLEKRFGGGDVPPQDVAGYKLAVPEAFAEVLQGWDPAKDEKLTAFLGNAHKAGMTQKQLDLVMGEYGRVMSEIKAASAGPSPEQQAEQVAAQLREVWKGDGEFDTNVGQAYKAANALAAKAGMTYDDLEAAGLGNNAAFLRIAAALGPEMNEDTPVGTQGGAGPAAEGWKEEVAALRAEQRAMPERDPRRETIQKKINALYDKHVKG